MTQAANAPLAGRTALVTGATNGIGEITAHELARLGAHVAIVGRNPGKLTATQARIEADVPDAQVTPFQADLSLMADVASLASAVRSRLDRLDMLVNNAGAIFADRQVTAEGLERTFALNHMAYFILTTRLEDLLVNAAAEHGEARVVSVSSGAHQFNAGAFDPDDLQFERRRYRGFSAYGASKLLNLLFAFELARRLAGTGVTSNALHPGFVRSGFSEGFATNPVLRAVTGVLERLVAITPEQGAQTSIYLASSAEVAGISGGYYARSAPAQAHARAYDEALAAQVWEISRGIAERA
jgi:retinol dehydrogenase 12